MGVRFGIEGTEIVAYLLGARADVRGIDLGDIRAFVETLAYGHEHNLIASRGDWPGYVRDVAMDVLALLPRRISESESDLSADEDVKHALRPLRRIFDRYPLVLVPLAGREDHRLAEEFAIFAARLPGREILSLIPHVYDERAVSVLSPGQGVRDALRRRDRWPGVIFNVAAAFSNRPNGRTRDGSRGSWFLRLGAAYGAVEELNEVMEGEPSNGLTLRRFRKILDGYVEREPGSSRCRVLHLSDLHFGTARSRETWGYLQASVARELPAVDRVVMSGDLFDQPRKADMAEFTNFSNGLRLLGAKGPIIVPGNHDQRIFGNKIGRFGRRRRALADLGWDPLVVDDDAKVVFVCFDSARDGDFARGEVSEAQLLSVATKIDVANAGGAYNDYLRVAVVHHHPYPYDTTKEKPIVDPRGWVGREALIEMRDSERFLTWCAGRGISLVLHGHKHVPRLVNAPIIIGGVTSGHKMTSVGCGTSTGVGGAPMSFNILEWSPESRLWSVDFMMDRGDGQGFRSAGVQSVVQPPLVT